MVRQLHLNAFLLNVGNHEASWRLPESDPVGSTGLAHFVTLAQIAERGTFDSVFIADRPFLQDVARRPASIIDPTVLLAAVATATSRIGLIATASTSYNAPYNLARRLASLDHVSNGRAGWNIVTTSEASAARNFGHEDRLAHVDRYRRAQEFVEVSIKLWDSWHDDTIVADQDSGIWGRADRIRPPHHRGEFFDVEGALNLSRSPQGRPLLVQAGSSGDGRRFAARFADAIFTVQQSIEDAQAFYADVKEQARQCGRDPGRVNILPGIVPVIGATEAQARARAQLLDDHLNPEFGRAQLARLLDVPVETLDLDRQLPEELPDASSIEGEQGRRALLIATARRERLTVREIVRRLGVGRGHHTVQGTPEQVAEVIERWFTSGAADGFNVMPPALPHDLSAFVDHVVPILRRRGIFRDEYTATTLRGHYGLPRPLVGEGAASS